MSPRKDNARSTTPTKPRPIATPNIPTAIVGDVSENKRVARRKRTTMATPSDAARNVVSEVVALVSISGRTRTTQIRTHAPMATMTPSASTADARDPSRRLTKTARPRARVACDSTINVSIVEADVVARDNARAKPNGTQLTTSVANTVNVGLWTGEPTTTPRPNTASAVHAQGEARDSARKPCAAPTMIEAMAAAHEAVERALRTCVLCF